MIISDTFWSSFFDKLPPVLTAAAALVAAIASLVNRKKIDEVHKVVNNQMTAELTKNATLTSKVEDLQKDKAALIVIAASPAVDSEKLKLID